MLGFWRPWYVFLLLDLEEEEEERGLDWIGLGSKVGKVRYGKVWYGKVCIILRRETRIYND